MYRDGKVLLAYLPHEERRELLSRVKLERRGPNAIVSKSALLIELQRVSEDDFATEDEEFAKGRIAIAVPVRNESRAVVAAIDLSAHTAISVEQLADGLRLHPVAAADRVSARLGYRRDNEVIARWVTCWLCAGLWAWVRADAGKDRSLRATNVPD
jgi:DNA-binding IclR family transcriptional regulator